MADVTKVNIDGMDYGIHNVPSGGSSGQVLAKNSGTDYDLKWVNQPSGGTTDYDDLTDKPQINSVTLSGNKSLSDLGIAAANDLSGKIDKPSSPSSGDFLCYNGTAWVATTLSVWQGGSY